jgi:hypothetical protein
MMRRISIPGTASIALVSALFWASPANATVMRVEFTGIFTSTTDATGTVFHNGTAANSGAGTLISGYSLWDLSLGGIFDLPSPESAYFDRDYEGCYCDPDSMPLRTWLTIGGVEYAPNLNMGTYAYANILNSPSQDAWGESFRSAGHYQLEPEVGGVADYLSVYRRFGIQMTDPTAVTLNSDDFSQPIDWDIGPHGYGTGFFLFENQIWTDGTSQRYSGTAGAFLTNATGTFAVTSLRVSQVPEPDTLALILAGGLLLGFARRRARSEPEPTQPLKPFATT